MTFDIAAILAVDGIASGAIYALVAIGTVLLFSVTRVMFVPFGDLAAFTALTLAALDDGKTPGTVNLVIALAVLAFAMEALALVRAGKMKMLPRAALLSDDECGWIRRVGGDVVNARRGRAGKQHHQHRRTGEGGQCAQRDRFAPGGKARQQQQNERQYHQQGTAKCGDRIEQ